MPDTGAMLSIEVVCDKCGRHPDRPIDAFLEMAPKVGAEVPFYLCAKCWLDHEGFDGVIELSRVELRHPL